MDRPKVRFSQISELSTKYNSEKNDNSENSKGSKTKVKIKSIIPVQLPVKILKSEVSNTRLKNTSEQCITSSIEELSNENNAKDLHVLNKQVEIDDLSKIQKSNDSIQAIVDEKKLNKSNFKFSNNISHSSENSEDSDIEVIQIIRTEKPDLKNKKKIDNIKRNTNTMQNYKTQKNDCELVIQSNTENKLYKTVKSDKENYANEQNKLSSVSRNTNKLLRDQSNNKKHKICKNVTASTIDCLENTVKESKKLGVMPCAKFRLKSPKKKKQTDNKLTEVQKTTVFYTPGTNCNVRMQLQMQKKLDESIDNDLYQNNNRKSIHSKHLLSHPEYNSTICAMKTLKNIEKEKIISDIENLPTTYKNLIRGKVSAVLDFAPYESIYKDLINLSIGDDDLPARLLRSKDPEPRNKDVVPKLADFYNPKYTEQFFVIINPRVLSPENVNTSSSFSVNNKISMWKICRDNW